MGAEQTEGQQRLPLLEPSALNREQAEVYERLRESLLPWARESGFAAEAPGGGGGLLGPFNALLYSPELGAAHLNYLATEREATDLDARLREVVILTVGAACQTEYELYAHRAVAAKTGLSAADIEALATGREPSGLTPDELTAHRFVYALVTDHRVPAALYAEAEKAFGHKCLVDLLHLTALYLGVSALLNAFEVPAPSQS